MASTLEDMFASLGVPDPAGWARSQREEGIDQLSRATLLVEFAGYAKDGATVALLDNSPPAPTEALAAIRAKGVSDETLRPLLEFACANALFAVCSLLDGSTEIALNPEDRSVALGLSDPSGDDHKIVDLSLHESFGEVVNTVTKREVFWA